ncbi:alpha/beta fold hydrolase [Dyadobacter sp. CY312]|uniref:alpha/beta fold hydrolase n=1 Tax=Dyadobacter sp. CY312 TaxID=2907303 RepID=UPI001F170FED|nr:alpha/beta hydrolase [Dyadobacter sp. CY312]MCE7044602.1 alpha/beta hydrolase [Dyadobacter sp. CY312]
MMLFKNLIILLFITVIANAQTIDTLIDVPPFNLHFRILKGNNPPILLESGGGLDATQWDSIADPVHRQLRATVITYDRAGFGKSSLDTANFTILQEIKSLEAALEKFGYLDAKFLLVGHSLGGFYNRVFAARHPKQVKGIILLDPRIPSYQDMKFAKKIFEMYSRKDFEPDNLSLYHLLANMERTSDYVRQVPLSDSIPILDVMAEIGPFQDSNENERFKNDQRNLVNGYKNRRLILAEGSSHNIPDDKPGLVIKEIVDFYRRHLLEK